MNRHIAKKNYLLSLLLNITINNPNSEAIVDYKLLPISQRTIS